MNTLRSAVLPLLAILALAGVILFSRGGGSKSATPAYFDTTLTLENAKQLSVNSGKPIFAFVTADWCGPCQSFKKNALTDSRVADAISSKTVPLYVDATSRNSPDAAALGVSALPSVVLISSKGERLASFQGATSADNVLAFLQHSIK